MGGLEPGSGIKQLWGEKKPTKLHLWLNKVNTLWNIFTISLRRRAKAASRLAGLWASRLSAFLPRLRSSWIMVFFTYIRSISLQEPPLEFSKPLRLFGSGGRPSIQAIPPREPFVDLPFIVPRVTERTGDAFFPHRKMSVLEARRGFQRTHSQSSPAQTHRATAVPVSASGGQRRHVKTPGFSTVNVRPQTCFITREVEKIKDKYPQFQ